MFTNAGGSNASNPATLTVHIGPAVTTNPTNQSVIAGGQVTFTAAASNSTGVQWQVSTGGAFSDISGAFSTTYSFTSALTDNGKQYHAVFSNGAGCGTSTTSAATLTVRQITVTVAPASLPGGTVGVNYNQTITASGGTAPYHFTFTGTLPPGVTLADNGQITGKPTGGGTFNISVMATDSTPSPGTFHNNPAKAYSIVIAPPTITLNPAKLNTMKVGVAFSQTVTASGGTAPLIFALTGTLPTGITFDTNSGVISGTPTATGAFSFGITATDSSTPRYSSPTANYGAKIDPPTVLLTPGSPLPPGKVGSGYNTTVTASGGIAPYTYTASGTLPAGLSLDASNGQLSGTPSAAGKFTFSVSAKDSTSGPGAPATASKVYSLTIAP